MKSRLRGLGHYGYRYHKVQGFNVLTNCVTSHSGGQEDTHLHFIIDLLEASARSEIRHLKKSESLLVSPEDASLSIRKRQKGIHMALQGSRLPSLDAHTW